MPKKARYPESFRGRQLVSPKRIVQIDKLITDELSKLDSKSDQSREGGQSSAERSEAPSADSQSSQDNASNR